MVNVLDAFSIWSDGDASLGDKFLKAHGSEGNWRKADFRKTRRNSVYGIS